MVSCRWRIIIFGVIAKFVFKVNEYHNGAIVDRLTRIYSSIYIDEVQDLASYDLDILKLLLVSSIYILLAGDPRQVTYLTHHANRYKKYRNGLIKNFIGDEYYSLYEVDESILLGSYRNCHQICKFTSLLYPNLQETKSINPSVEKDSHMGIFAIKPRDVDIYTDKFKPARLLSQKAICPDINYGASKGRGFKRVLISPTSPIEKFLRDGKLTKAKRKNGEEVEICAFDISKFYGAITRAEFNVGIITKYTDSEEFTEGVQKWEG